MRREWPLLAGLVLSAGLVFWSTTIGGAVGAKPTAESARTPDVGDVAPADVPPAHEPAGKPERKEAHERPKPAKPSKRRSKPGGSAGRASTAGTGSVPADAPAPTRENSAGGGGERPAREEPPGPVVVELTGNAGQTTRGGVLFRCAAGSRSPVTGQNWTLDVNASKGGRAARGEVRVDVVHQGKVVGHIDTGRLRGGSYEHTVQWPPESVGHPLTVKVAITANGVDQTFLYKLKVRAA